MSLKKKNCINETLHVILQDIFFWGMGGGGGGGGGGGCVAGWVGKYLMMSANFWGCQHFSDKSILGFRDIPKIDSPVESTIP